MMKMSMKSWLVKGKFARTMCKKLELLLTFLSIVFFGAIFSDVVADPVEDMEALLEFYSGVDTLHPLNWDEGYAVCDNWIGVTCDSDQSRVVALRLPGCGIQGSISPNTLGRLSALEILSLRSNEISGSFPSDLLGLESLTALYLENNRLSGPLPLDISAWKNINFIDLSNNAFTGSIPPTITNLTHLTGLNLSNNSFSGEIPDLMVPSLQELNLANNNLVGNVPDSLKRFPSWVFTGNNISLAVADPPTIQVEPPSSLPVRKTQKFREPAIIGLASFGCVLGLAIIAIVIMSCCSKKACDVKDSAEKKKEIYSKDDASSSREKNSLVFFEGSNLAFDLDDLLRASAEVLGKGTFGVTYRAALEDATTMVVKRLKEVNAPKREFEQHMLLVGDIRHENVIPLRAYYHSKDEKLIVSDYFEQGSISSVLHGKKRDDHPALDWETRLRIAIGAARGIAHIHIQNWGKLVHGNIKASNIFLNPKGYGCVSDVGLATLMNPLPPPAQKVPGYRAPELIDTRKASQASDVFSYGVFILEILTGKCPTPTAAGEEVVNLVKWVNSVVREEWTSEVFDVELLKYDNTEEMVEMLQIGLICTAKIPEHRPRMPDVVEMVEGIGRTGTRSRPSPAGKSEISVTTPTQSRADMPSPILRSQIASPSSAMQ